MMHVGDGVMMCGRSTIDCGAVPVPVPGFGRSGSEAGWLCSGTRTGVGHMICLISEYVRSMHGIEMDRWC